MEPNSDYTRTTPAAKAFSPRLINLRSQFEHTLLNTVLMTEIAMDLKDRCVAGEKYVTYLRSVTVKATKNLSNLQSLTKSFLLVAQRMTNGVLGTIENLPIADPGFSAMKNEYEKLLTILEKELADSEDIESSDQICGNLNNISEKIKLLETRQKISDNTPYLPPTNSAKSFKSDIDEKYPDNLGRDSLIDLNNVVNLPSVPEDIFGYTSKPTRTSSLSSLKSLRKVKLYLQRAGSTSDDDEDNSEPDEHDMTKYYMVSTTQKKLNFSV